MQRRSALLYYHKTFFSAYAKVPYAEVERPCILVVCDQSKHFKIFHSVHSNSYVT